MTGNAEACAARELVFREAFCLDTRAWQDWLNLFHEEAIFWVPTWKDDGEPTADPQTELSLIYCSSRDQLKERVDRVAGGRSIASLPPMRTAHAVSNILVAGAGTGGALTVTSVATAHIYNVKKREQHVFFSLQEHKLLPDGHGGYAITQKKLLLLNDYIPRMIDFYTI